MTGIVDAHHHIWRQADLPWLVGPMQPRIFGPYEPIRRDYPIREYLDDIAGAGVVQSVYVQTNWAKPEFEHEAEWVQTIHAETGWPHAIVAYADFSAKDVRPQLDRLAADFIFSRQQLALDQFPIRDVAHIALDDRVRAFLVEIGHHFHCTVAARVALER